MEGMNAVVERIDGMEARVLEVPRELEIKHEIWREKPIPPCHG